MTLALILILAGVTFGRAINGVFSREEAIFDDPAIFEMEPWYDGRRHPFFRQCLNFHRTPRAVTHMTYRWTWALFGYSPIAWHAGNLLLHLANVALVFYLVRLSWPAGATAAAALFAVHPMGVAAVCYVSGRAAVLATFFTLCGLALWAQGHYVLMILAEYFACKSKQDAPAYALLYPVFWFWLRLT